jgi:hypothetical protein
MEIKENMLEKLQQNKIPQWSRCAAGQFVWTCQRKPSGLVRGFIEVDQIDSEGRITHLDNGMKLQYADSLGDIFYDIYIVSGPDEKILIQKP